MSSFRTKTVQVLAGWTLAFFLASGIFLTWLTFWPPQDIYLGLKVAAGFVVTFRLGIVFGVLALGVGALHYSFLQFGGKKKKPARSPLTDNGLPWGVP
ncbi:MAG: hypothetical protein WCF77_03405 [Minisyncoccia bacterium]|jgi:hypothetical protein